MPSKRSVKTGKRKARVFDSEEEDSETFEMLEDAPPHMRKITNEHAPVIVDDSEDETVPRRRRRKVKAEKDREDVRKKKRHEGETIFLDDEAMPPSLPLRTREPIKPPRDIGTVGPSDLPHNDLPLFAHLPNDPHSEVGNPTSVERPPTPAAVALADDPAFEAEIARAAARWDNLSAPPAASSHRGTPMGTAFDGERDEQATAGTSTGGPLPFVAAHHLPQILDILPDIDVDWALAHLEEKHALGLRGGHAGALVQEALELPEGYPKASERKAVAKVDTPKVDYAKREYRSEFRRGQEYADKSLAALQELFSTMPATHVQVMFIQSGSLYYPTYTVLSEHLARAEKPYTPLKRPRQVKGVLASWKGKGVGIPAALGTAGMHVNGDHEGFPDGNTEWEREHAFLEAKLDTDTREREQQVVKDAMRMAELAAGNGFECGCCFGEVLMEDMFQCDEGHLFCRECCTRHAEIKLGDQTTNITCMDGSGCPAPFPEIELSRLLSAKSFDLYHRLKLASELATANIEGLETCPTCDYAVVIDNPDEKLFVCQHVGCKQISCRKCRRKEHLPKSCEEMEADRNLDQRHAIEDAMSDALIRRCPKCSKSYMKESGCNKITCSGCRTLSCYVCQKMLDVKHPYGHFDQLPGQAASSSNVGRCRLWENQQEQKDQEAVVRARDEARAEAVKRATEEGIQLAEEDLNVEAPPVPANSLPGHRQRVPIPAARPLAAAFGPPLNYVAQPDALPVLARANPGTVQERGPDGVPMWRQYLGGMIQARNPPEPVPGPVWAHNPFGAFVARPGFPRVIAPLPARTMNLAGAAPPTRPKYGGDSRSSTSNTGRPAVTRRNASHYHRQ